MVGTVVEPVVVGRAAVADVDGVEDVHGAHLGVVRLPQLGGLLALLVLVKKGGRCT